MRVRRGDMFQLGSHRILCGDATHLPDVHRLLLGERADMVFTDPPYNVGYTGGPKPARRNRKLRGDVQREDQWEAFCANAAKAIHLACPKGDVYCWRASSWPGEQMLRALLREGMHQSTTIIWFKHHFAISRANYHRQFELMVYGWFENSSFRGGRKQSDVWRYDKPYRSRQHPTMKPVALCRRAIENSCPEGGTVFDGFAGSGSTLIAASMAERRCLAMEIDPACVKATIQRWSAMMGRAPKQLRKGA